ncbi:MAG: 4Fe-4S dicluster domain-containing protein [Clostridia bacterium]|jgi:predicted aldo/keto reductase-like oxidoreductase|nr:4Fe-4S dicluster domain-containing protein [Clostridia bacterium]
MQYRDFGNTGVKVSVLGFGAMRLPQEQVKGKSRIKQEESVEIIQKAFELGVNYVDTAYVYNEGDSELAVGKALKGWREKVYLSTKLPIWYFKKTSDYRRFLEEELERLKVDYIDFYHFHCLSGDKFKNTVLKYDLLREARKAKDEGLITHISFSFHDKPKVMKRLIDIGIFESVLCQYNLLDKSNEEAMAYAKEKGLGVAVMGPVGGGRLASSGILKGILAGSIKSTPELALRFVLANEKVSVALSGMGSMRMVEENVRAASLSKPLSNEELETIEAFIKERRKKEEITCNMCEYCQPCPSQVAISRIFELMNYYSVYGLKEYALSEYKNIGSGEKDEREKADACTECGECEEKCPQKIKIMEKLKECHQALG